MEYDAEEGDDVLLATDRLVFLLSRDEEEDAEAEAEVRRGPLPPPLPPPPPPRVPLGLSTTASSLR